MYIRTITNVCIQDHRNIPNRWHMRIILNVCMCTVCFSHGQLEIDNVATAAPYSTTLYNFQLLRYFLTYAMCDRVLQTDRPCRRRMYPSLVLAEQLKGKYQRTCACFKAQVLHLFSTCSNIMNFLNTELLRYFFPFVLI